MMNSGTTTPLASQTDHLLRLTFLNVGQGDSTIICLPREESGERRALLVDCPSGKSQRVISHLREMGVTRLELVIVTHSDDDHCGGIRDILKEFIDPTSAPELSTSVGEVAYIVDSAQPPGRQMSNALRTFRRDLADFSIQRQCLWTNNPYLDTRNYRDVQITFLHPSKENVLYASTTGDRNSTCLVVLLEYEGVRALLAAVLTEQGWAWLRERNDLSDTNGRGALYANILKVPHHGAEWTSPERMTDLLASVQPEYAIVSTGTSNTYHHPSQQIFTALKAQGTVKRIFCTQATVERCGVTSAGNFPCADSVEFLIGPTTCNVSPSRINHLSRIRMLRHPACLWLPWIQDSLNEQGSLDTTCT